MTRPALSALVALLAAPALADEGWSAAPTFGMGATFRDLGVRIAAGMETPAPAHPDLRTAIAACWTGHVSSTVTVAFALTPEGRLEGDVRLVRANGGDRAARQAAFQTARRAILQCQGDGYPLPAATPNSGRIEMTFDSRGTLE